MSPKPAVRVVVASVALAASLAVAWQAYRGHGSLPLVAVWFASVVAFALAAAQRRREGRLQGIDLLLFLLAAVLPVLVRAVNIDPNRMHADEFLTGYFSATHDFAHTNFFGSMPEYWEWQGQFPKMYFFLQRAFFTVFGVSTASLRMSVQVHVAVVGAMLFLIGREMFGRAAGIIAVVLYSFLAMSVYLETLGLFLIGATSVFTIFFYFLVRHHRAGGAFPAAMAGIACGFCYLMYYSSYFAGGILLASFAVRWLRTRRLAAVRDFGLALAGMLVVLAPFLAFVAKNGDYALRRAKDMSLLSGLSSPHREAIARGANPVPILWNNLILDLKAFYKNGVAGAGGFEFGHFALFDRFSLVLLVAGLAACLVLVWKRSEILLVFLVLGGSLASVVLAVPPPTGHRFVIAFPFFALVMALPLSLLLKVPRLPAGAAAALVAGLLLVYASINERRYVDAIAGEDTSDELRLSELLNTRFGGRTVYVAAFDAYGYQKVFFFRDRWKNRHVETRFHDYLLKNFKRDEKYVYVVTLIEDFRKDFRRADPTGKFFPFSVGYTLFAN